MLVVRAAAEWGRSRYMKRKILYLVILAAVLICIWLADEGSEPLVLKGTDLEQQEGVSDYTGLIGIDDTSQYYGQIGRAHV